MVGYRENTVFYLNVFSGEASLEFPSASSAARGGVNNQALVLLMNSAVLRAFLPLRTQFLNKFLIYFIYSRSLQMLWV